MLTKAEQKLTEAIHMVTSGVREEALRPLSLPNSGARRPADSWLSRFRAPGRRTGRWLAPVAAATAIGLVAVAMAALPHGRPPSSASRAVAPVAHVIRWPGGVAYDAANQTIYVVSDVTADLTMINARSCNATVQSGCQAAKRVSTGGVFPVSVAVDQRTHTVYVVNRESDTVAVFNADTCNATDTAGCAASPPLIRVGRAPAGLAVDEATDTIYVVSTGTGTVSVINGAACDASHTSGCGVPPATAQGTSGANSVTVDDATNTVYVTGSRSVAVIDGAACDSAGTSGCSRVPALIRVRSPKGVAVDDAHHTVYITGASGASGVLTMVNRDTCDATVTSGCASGHLTAVIGQRLVGVPLIDMNDSTLYVANGNPGYITMINTAACDVTVTARCGKSSPAFPAGAGARQITSDPLAHTVYVVNGMAGTISMINSRVCDAAEQTGCPTRPSSALAGELGRHPPLSQYVTYCGHVTAPGTSGQPAARFTGSATELASGSVGGQAWSLWAKKGVTGPLALESGGVVLDGRWYGLCQANASLMGELVNVGRAGIVYGYAVYRGKVQFKLTSAGHVFRAWQIVPVGYASFFIGSLPKPACSYHRLVLQARNSRNSFFQASNYGYCAAGHLVATTGGGRAFGGGGQGAWNAHG